MLAALALSIVVGVSAASATTTAECQAQLDSFVRTRRPRRRPLHTRDFGSAIGKLDAAASKLADGRSADSIQTLADFQSLLHKLATAEKPKLDPAVAEALVAEAQAVADCIGAIAPQRVAAL